MSRSSGVIAAGVSSASTTPNLDPRAKPIAGRTGGDTRSSRADALGKELLPQLEFLDLARGGERQVAHHPQVGGQFVAPELGSQRTADVLECERCSGIE